MADAGKTAPYSQRDIACAVKLSALLGWAGVIGVPVFSYAYRNGFDLNSLSLVFWYALFGLPISLFTCWLLVKPFLRIMMRRQISYFRAAIWGAGIAATLIAIRLAIRVFRAWRMSRDPKRTFSFGDGIDTISVNGVLTDYGWWLFSKNSLNFIAICILAALTVRLIIGPGKYDPPIEAKQ
ncbi:hypothetical protein [Ruegeria atlantica]|uniref:Uncharacterized protein n=1 Tax=Ruegeria atlantica TaxID=81569 RepID=A0A0P1EVE4_9RHOB|nr:hypothetical protein [Ruegeria atlantica]CUH45736.1 hypothetical protein RUM4293_04653 [Ruegeria atlantica]